MKIKKKGLVSYILFILIVLISGIMMFSTENILINVLSMILVQICIIFLNRDDILHPSIWFGFFLVLYSIAYPILYKIGDLGTVSIGYDSLGIKISWVALVSFLLSVGFSSNRKNSLKDNTNMQKLYYMIDSANLVFIISSVLMIGIIGYIYMKGIRTKAEIFLHSSIHSSIAIISTTFLLSFSIVYQFHKLVQDKKHIKITIFAVLLSVFFYFFTGERDVIFKLILVLTSINFSIGTFKRKQVFLIGIISMLLIPALLNFGIRGGTFDPVKYVSNDSALTRLLTTFLRSEFGSASRNTQVIVQNIEKYNFLYLKPFLSSFAELPLLPNLTGFSSIQWYYSTFFPDRQAGSGVGFSLVGEGFLSFGTTGVVFWFVFLGLLMRVLYKRSKNNIIFYTVYILMIPSVIYSIRASLLVIISGLTRHAAALIFFVCIGRILRSKKNRKGNQNMRSFKSRNRQYSI